MATLPHTVTLAGIKHSGKSTLGRRLAERMGYAFYDVDEVISQKYNTGVRELFRSIGEEKFRSLEAEEEKLLALKSENKVISLGGGAVNSKFFDLALQDILGTLVMIDIPDDVAEKRVFAKGVPAYLEKYTDPKAALKEINNARRSAMREVCQAVYLSDSTLTPNKQAERFFTFLEQKELL